MCVSSGLGGLIVGGRGLFVKFIELEWGVGLLGYLRLEGFGVLQNSACLGPCCRTWEG